MFPEDWVYHIGPAIDNLVVWLLHTIPGFFEGISSIILSILLNLKFFFQVIPWWLIIVIIGGLSWLTTRRWRTTFVLILLPFVMGFFGLWPQATETLALVTTAVIISLTIGLPVGILMAEVDIAETIFRPILDGMQTMPSFVYLIPAVMLFGLGKVPAIMATIIYSTPPVVRLTNLGLRQVPHQVQEATIAFGATRLQLLKEVRIPLAIPSILAGVNQTTMMALAMTVIAAMIGAGGVGREVLFAINHIEIGRGFEAGGTVVILAIIIDRLTQGIAKRWEPPSA